jgi:twinkle protein
MSASVTAKSWVDVGIDLPAGAIGEVDVLCPQCSHTRKKRTQRCLSVNTVTSTWHCHHCGWSGRIGTGGNSYGAPLRQRMPAPPPPRVFALPKPLPEDPLPAHVLRWFAEKRCIPESVVCEAGIRWANGAILFPYQRAGRVINVKHRLLASKRFWLTSGAERIL